MSKEFIFPACVMIVSFGMQFGYALWVTIRTNSFIIGKQCIELSFPCLIPLFVYMVCVENVEDVHLFTSLCFVSIVVIGAMGGAVGWEIKVRAGLSQVVYDQLLTHSLICGGVIPFVMMWIWRFNI